MVDLFSFPSSSPGRLLSLLCVRLDTGNALVACPPLLYRFLFHGHRARHCAIMNFCVSLRVCVCVGRVYSLLLAGGVPPRSTQIGMEAARPWLQDCRNRNRVTGHLELRLLDVVVVIGLNGPTGVRVLMRSIWTCAGYYLNSEVQLRKLRNSTPRCV